MLKKSLIFLGGTIILSYSLLIPVNTAKAANLKKGKKIFQRNCMRCHLLKQVENQQAPTADVLASTVSQKIAKELKWLISWIKDPQAVKKAECQYKDAMITDEQALDIIKYLNSMNKQK